MYDCNIEDLKVPPVRDDDRFWFSPNPMITLLSANRVASFISYPNWYNYKTIELGNLKMYINKETYSVHVRIS